MSFWTWLLVDLLILILGGGWITFLLWNLFQQGKRLARTVQPMMEQLERLEPQLSALESRAQTTSRPRSED